MATTQPNGDPPQRQRFRINTPKSANVDDRRAYNFNRNLNRIFQRVDVLPMGRRLAEDDDADMRDAIREARQRTPPRRGLGRLVNGR